MNPPADPSTPPDPRIPLSANDPGNAAVPASRPTSSPPVITGSPPMPGRKSSWLRELASVLLSLCLGLFLASGVLSLLDDSLVLFSGSHFLTVVSGILAVLTYLLMVVIYGLMGITPIIPKRIFLPVILFNVLALLVVFPTLIYHRNWILQLDWALSFIQVALVLGILHWLRGGGRFRWLIVGVRHLGNRVFGWLNLCGFLALNVFVIMPALVAYLAFCASLAVGHFSDGFLALRPGGLILQARKYARDDGKTIMLFPMSHIAETDFYQAVSQSVASNSIVLLEGVTDDQNLLTNRLSYERAARSLGLAEQHEDLHIRRGELVRADVDVRDFSPGTIEILNLIALVHSRGLNSGTLALLAKYSPSPDVEQRLFEELLVKRNEHLLKELHKRLPESDSFVIPWGAAHMPGIAKEIQKSGFHLVETRDYVSIRFGSGRHRGSGAEKVRGRGNAK